MRHASRPIYSHNMWSISAKHMICPHRKIGRKGHSVFLYIDSSLTITATYTLRTNRVTLNNPTALSVCLFSKKKKSFLKV